MVVRISKEYLKALAKRRASCLRRRCLFEDLLACEQALGLGVWVFVGGGGGGGGKGTRACSDVSRI